MNKHYRAIKGARAAAVTNRAYPLRVVKAYDAYVDRELLECGHWQRPPRDLAGPTNAYRRRCRQCSEGPRLPVEHVLVRAKLAANSEIEHRTTSTKDGAPDCWCLPRMEVYENGNVVIHNARGEN